MMITEFLEARITEDERAARNASPGPWSYSDIESVGGGTIYDPTVAIASVDWDTDHIDSRIRRTRPDWQADATGGHIVRHDPSRVLAECAAKREILAMHVPVKDEGWYSGAAHGYLWCGCCGSIDDSPEPYPCGTIQALAAVYKEHPEYKAEWAL